MTRVVVMASAICSPKFTICSSSSCSVISYPKRPNCHLSTWVPQLGLSHFSPWNGLKHMGISIRPTSLKLERKGKCRGKGVYASLFGVGAPEALVIGVVALLVFGPKGLAEVARNLGKTLRAFQPTIRELQEVSREFKSSLEREIGLDDISNSMQNTYSSNKTNSISTPSSVASTDDSQTVVDPNGAPSSSRAYSSEEYLKTTEEQLKSASQQQKQTPPQEESQIEPQTQPKATVQEAAAAMPPLQKPDSET